MRIFLLIAVMLATVFAQSTGIIFLNQPDQQDQRFIPDQQYYRPGHSSPSNPPPVDGRVRLGRGVDPVCY